MDQCILQNNGLIETFFNWRINTDFNYRDFITASEKAQPIRFQIRNCLFYNNKLYWNGKIYGFDVVKEVKGTVPKSRWRFEL